MARLSILVMGLLLFGFWTAIGEEDYKKDPELVQKIGAGTALEVRATGILHVFAPCITVCRDPSWGWCYESYKEDPKIVQAMTKIIPGLKGVIPPDSPKGISYVAGKKKVAACAKHYVGDGGTTDGINEDNTVISWHGLLSIHEPGYHDAIINGVSTVMISYSSWNGNKMHANHTLITAFLKNTLKFRGFVISDWQGIDRITSPPHANHSYSIQAGISAGIDMIMNGESADEPLVPLAKKAPKILVAGILPDNLGYQCGGWTIEWQGFGGNNLTKVDTDYVKSNKFSYAMVVVGEQPYAETHGDSLNLTHPDPGLSTITNVCGAVKCVVIIISGRPLVIQPYVPLMDVLVAAWLPGTEGQEVADVLFGGYGFTRKLPHTWFKTVDQLPMNVGDKHYDPLFPYGHGLTTKPTKAN
ncbi:Glycoside hydrolase, family 3, N-terminal [Dillenia turbinata]|uniref:Glycoside hydrolase, family 3, N-terminal n=1 Tax=Dillenia turbinata TaxID=194707 RepID=A0AAN8ZQU5_9MAGN